MNKGTYVLKRLGQSVIIFWIIITMLFFLFRLGLPDPTQALIAEGLSREERALVQERFGLDQPLGTQYLIYLRNTLRLEFGTSFYYKAPVAGIIHERLLNTLVLMFLAILISYIIGPLLGVLLSWKRGTRFEAGSIAVALLFRSAPVFWTGMIAIMLFSIRWGIFPASGMRTIPFAETTFLTKIFTLDFLHHLLLPSLTIGLYYVGLPMLIMRNTMLEVMGEDFIELCRGKGMSEGRVMYRHAARNALLPVVTQAAVTIGLAIGGQVVIETVFSWPGLGREMLQAVRNSDYPLAQASFLLMAAMILVMNLIADLLYSYLDPRVVYRGGK